MRASTWLHKISKVPTRDVVPLSSLTYHPRYSGTRKLDLSRTFNSVDEQNRFLPLELLLHQFSGHVGRRQYKMMCDLSVHLDHLKKIGMDWHDMKYLTRDELMDLFNKELQLSHSEKAILLTMLQAKLCGVLRRSSNQRHSTTVCMNHGVAEHGWRCGRHGHTNDVYFEGKQKANPAVLQLAHRSAHRMAVRDGVRVDVRSEPDFRVVGRFHHETNRRVWSSPQNPLFHVSAIGFEFRVHPQDPRAPAQIEEAAPLWEMHASVVQQVVWEMLELHASERSTQPLDLQPNEMGAPDNPHAFTSAFTSSVRQEGKEVDDVVETRMISTSGKEQPWFRAPLPQSFEDGVPTILPYAPTIIIRATFRSIPRYATQEDVTTQLMQPVMDVSCLVHPSACFWWNAEAEATCVESILDYAKRTPYAIPFNLYLRVDLAKDERSSEEWPAEMERRRSAHAHHFDLRHFCSNHSSSTTN